MHPGHLGRAVWHKVHEHRFEVDQQGVGGRVVGSQRFTIEPPGVACGHLEGTAVQHDIALDALNPQTLQTPQQQPQTLDAQARVALAAQVDIALQHALADRALHIHRGAPGEGRSQLIQGHAGRHQFHQGGGVDQHLRTVADEGCTFAR